MQKYIFPVCSIQVTQSKVGNSHFLRTWLLDPCFWMGISTPSSKSETWTWNVHLLLTLAVRKRFGMFLWQAIGVMSHCSSQDAILSITCEHVVLKCFPEESLVLAWGPLIAGWQNMYQSQDWEVAEQYNNGVSPSFWILIFGGRWMVVLASSVPNRIRKETLCHISARERSSSSHYWRIQKRYEKAYQTFFRLMLRRASDLLQMSSGVEWMLSTSAHSSSPASLREPLRKVSTHMKNHGQDIPAATLLVLFPKHCSDQAARRHAVQTVSCCHLSKGTLPALGELVVWDPWEKALSALQMNCFTCSAVCSSTTLKGSYGPHELLWGPANGLWEAETERWGLSRELRSSWSQREWHIPVELGALPSVQLMAFASFPASFIYLSRYISGLSTISVSHRHRSAPTLGASVLWSNCELNKIFLHSFALTPVPVPERANTIKSTAAGQNWVLSGQFSKK